MATNKSPWVKNLNGALGPVLFPGKVQAGSSVAIKRGEICTFNETAGYFIPANAVADAAYSLAIANEEQKSTDSARYMEFIALRPDDVFEFPLAAAAAVELGDGLTLTASDSQTLTRDVDGVAVATAVGIEHYPEKGTSISTRAYVLCSFHPQFSYWEKNVKQINLRKVLTKTAAYTLTLEDCGAIVTNKGATGAVTLTAPNGVVPVGWWFDMVCAAAQVFAFDPKPDSASCIVKGGIQTAGKYVSVTDEGDYIRWVWDGADWIAVNSISGADADISVES